MRDAWQRKMSHESQFRKSAREAKELRDQDTENATENDDEEN